MKDQSKSSGRWVTAKVYAKHFGLSIYVLANWRYDDKCAGRAQPESGFPVYKRFGRAVRYWLEVSEYNPL